MLRQWQLVFLPCHAVVAATEKSSIFCTFSRKNFMLGSSAGPDRIYEFYGVPIFFFGQVALSTMQMAAS